MGENKTCYAIQNKKNLKMYIGVTKNLQQRISQHLQLLTLNKHNSELLQKEFNEYGSENFEVFILEENLMPTRAFKAELEYIFKYQTYDENYGYNLRERSKAIGHANRTLKLNVREGTPKSLVI